MADTGPLWHSGLDQSLDQTPAHHADSAPPATLRASAYGDSLFETILMQGNRGWLFAQHMDRLERGLSVLQLQPPQGTQVASIMGAARTAAAQHPHCVLKLQLGAAALGRGYGRAGESQSNLSAALYPARTLPGQRQDPARLLLCQTRLAEQPLLAGVKHGNRLEQVLASNEWQAAGCDEGLMLSTSCLLIEGTHSNVLVQHAGRLLTPSLQRAGVAGVLRERLLELTAMQVADISLADLSAAEGLWLVNSVFGLRAVSELMLPEGPISFDLARSAALDAELDAALQRSLAEDMGACEWISPLVAP